MIRFESMALPKRGREIAGDTVKVIIRVIPQGMEIDATLPLRVTGEQVIKKIVEDTGLDIPKVDLEGQTITYELFCKDTGEEIKSETLLEAGIKDGYILFLTPVMFD